MNAHRHEELEHPPKLLLLPLHVGDGQTAADAKAPPMVFALGLMCILGLDIHMYMHADVQPHTDV